MSPSEHKPMERKPARLFIKKLCRSIASYWKSARFHRIKRRHS